MFREGVARGWIARPKLIQIIASISQRAKIGGKNEKGRETRRKSPPKIKKTDWYQIPNEERSLQASSLVAVDDISMGVGDNDGRGSLWGVNVICKKLIVYLSAQKSRDSPLLKVPPEEGATPPAEEDALSSIREALRGMWTMMTCSLLSQYKSLRVAAHFTTALPPWRRRGCRGNRMPSTAVSSPERWSTLGSCSVRYALSAWKIQNVIVIQVADLDAKVKASIDA